MNQTTYAITPEQAALITQRTAEVERAKAMLDLVLDAVLRGHGVTEGVVSAFDARVPSLTVTSLALPDAPAPSPAPSSES